MWGGVAEITASSFVVPSFSTPPSSCYHASPGWSPTWVQFPLLSLYIINIKIIITIILIVSNMDDRANVSALGNFQEYFTTDT